MARHYWRKKQQNCMSLQQKKAIFLLLSFCIIKLNLREQRCTFLYKRDRSFVKNND